MLCLWVIRNYQIILLHTSYYTGLTFCIISGITLQNKWNSQKYFVAISAIMVDFQNVEVWLYILGLLHRTKFAWNIFWTDMLYLISSYWCKKINLFGKKLRQSDCISWNALRLESTNRPNRSGAASPLAPLNLSEARWGHFKVGPTTCGGCTNNLGSHI